MKGQKTPAFRKRSGPNLSCVRSAISNGSVLLHDLDHRSGWARRLRDLINDHVSDLGGPDLLSSSELILIRRAAMLCLQCEMQEQRWAQEHEGVAGPKQLMEYGRATNTLRRVLESLGLKRRQKDVTPTLNEYIASKRQDEVAEYDEVDA